MSRVDDDFEPHSSGKLELSHMDLPKNSVVRLKDVDDRDDDLATRSPNPASPPLHSSGDRACSPSPGHAGGDSSPYDAHHMASDLLDRLRESQMTISHLESVIEDKEALGAAERLANLPAEERFAEEHSRRVAAEERLHSSELESSRLQVMAHTLVHPHRRKPPAKAFFRNIRRGMC